MATQTPRQPLPTQAIASPEVLVAKCCGYCCKEDQYGDHDLCGCRIRLPRRRSLEEYFLSFVLLIFIFSFIFFEFGAQWGGMDLRTGREWNGNGHGVTRSNGWSPWDLFGNIQWTCFGLDFTLLSELRRVGGFHGGRTADRMLDHGMEAGIS
ncbi:uncharacterized protein RSE6_03748 [Rhynchosporium secalis]|uniref:Uncharacterized protein n=1 Tax=Rhynchosporium secalis TaxID=38038 RepID=A0A1E1M3J2_RHYSE|nr:uncharacterized protein RSE6_03748 [Rhynchosporium secalis]